MVLIVLPMGGGKVLQYIVYCVCVCVITSADRNRRIGGFYPASPLTFGSLYFTMGTLFKGDDTFCATENITKLAETNRCLVKHPLSNFCPSSPSFLQPLPRGISVLSDKAT
jgi:hypothetical protein